MTELLSPCIECKDFRECIFSGNKEWYSYPEIRYCPYQIIWILNNRGELLEDKWPEDNVQDNEDVKSGYAHEAYYVKPRVIIGEVNYRLSKVSRDAKDVFMQELDRGTYYKDLLDISKSVLMYLKGFRRKNQTFSQWRRGER